MWTHDFADDDDDFVLDDKKVTRKQSAALRAAADDLLAMWEKSAAGQCYKRCRAVLDDAGDPDTEFLLAVSRTTDRLRDYAFTKQIDLRKGDQWINPQSLFPHTAKLVHLLKGFSFSPAYRAWQDERTAELVTRITDNRDLRRAVANWPRMGLWDRKDAAHQLGRLQNAVFARHITTEPTIKTKFFFEARPAEPDPYYVRGTHGGPQLADGHDIESGPRVNVISYNMHRDTNFHETATAMDVIHHENLHALQSRLAADYANDHMPDNHPLRREARLFAALEIMPHIYVSRIKCVYRRHPLEQDTFAQSARFVDELRVAMKAHGTDIDRPSPPRRTLFTGMQP